MLNPSSGRHLRLSSGRCLSLHARGYRHRLTIALAYVHALDVAYAYLHALDVAYAYLHALDVTADLDEVADGVLLRGGRLGGAC